MTWHTRAYQRAVGQGRRRRIDVNQRCVLTAPAAASQGDRPDINRHPPGARHGVKRATGFASPAFGGAEEAALGA